MPRKLRLEYAGAVYHVISRGNYRAKVFGRDVTKTTFLKCLDEACTKASWVVHAWCVMSNHYHLCLATPQGNLVEGMRWLQSTFALRFNRLRDERGHLFQGRYQALPVSPDAVGRVCHYIHLNPVRAKLVEPAGLSNWPWTSVAALMKPRARPAWQAVEEALTDAGGLADTTAGRHQYLEYLGWLHEDERGKKELEFERISRDWAVGPREFKQELIHAHGELVISRKAGAASDQHLVRALWAERIDHYLRAVGKTEADVQKAPKGAAWKVAIAAAMKQGTTASNPWLAARLNMGSPFRLSRLAMECGRHAASFEPYVNQITKCKV